MIRRINAPTHLARRRSRVIPAVLFALASLIAAAVWLPGMYPRRSDHVAADSGANAGKLASTKNMPEVKEELRSVQHRLDALESSIAERERERALARAVPSAAPSREADEKEAHLEITSAAAVRLVMFHKLDDLLVTETAGARDRRAAAIVVEGEVGSVLGDKARLVSVNCATAFCKVTIEEDTTTLHPPLEVASISDKAPSVRHETVYSYENEAGLKRTMMYVAREGYRLPVLGPEAVTAARSALDAPHGL
jgi:hypothetical protein